MYDKILESYQILKALFEAINWLNYGKPPGKRVQLCTQFKACPRKYTFLYYICIPF